MAHLQQQKDAIDQQAQKTKDDADAQAVLDREAAAKAEIAEVMLEAEEKAKQIQYNSQK